MMEDRIPYDLTAAREEIRVWHKQLLRAIDDAQSHLGHWYPRTMNEEPEYVMALLYQFAMDNEEVFTSAISLLRSYQRYTSFLEDSMQVSPSGSGGKI